MTRTDPRLRDAIRREIARHRQREQFTAHISDTAPLTVRLGNGVDVHCSHRLAGVRPQVGDLVQVQYTGEAYIVLDKLVPADDDATPTTIETVIGDNTVDTQHIVDAAITNLKLAFLSVDTANIVDAAVETAKIALAAVDTAQLVDEAVETAKIALAAVDTGQIADLAVETAKIAAAAITTAKIDNLAVTTALIDNAAVTNAKIDNLAVDAAKIAALAVTTAKIDNAAVTNAKIDSLAVDTAQIALAAITEALIDDLAVTDAKIANMVVDKLLGGALQVAEYIESTGFVFNPEDPIVGFRIDGDGTAAFTDVVVGSAEYQVDSGGNASFASLSVADDDISIGGSRVLDERLNAQARGVVAFASRAEDVTFTTAETAVLELLAQLERDRMYRAAIPTLAFTSSGDMTTPARYSIRLRENGDASPTTSSNLLTRASPPPLHTNTARNYTTDMEYNFMCVDFGLETDASGEYADTPDAAALDITGDIDMRIEFNLDDWTFTGDRVLASKYIGAGDQRAWYLSINDDHTIAFNWGTDGLESSFQTATSTETIDEGQFIAVRATLDVDNGSGGWTARFYTASTMEVDNETGLAPPWVQLGDDVTGAGTTSIFGGTAPVAVSAANAGGSAFTATSLVGLVRRFALLDGIDGTPVAEPDFTALGGQWVIGDTSASDGQRTWTAQGGAAISYEYAAVAATLPPGDTRFLLTADITNAGTGDNSALIDTAVGATNPIQIVIEDSGAFVPNTGINHSGSGGGTTAKKTYTRTYNATGSRTYRGDDSIHATNGELAQGDGGFGNGDMKSWVGFDQAQIQSDLTGATILKCEFYLYYDHWYYNGGGTAVIGTHSETAVTSASYSGGKSNSNRKQVANWSRNEGKWVSMGTGVGKDLKSGAAAGIMIGPDPGANQLIHYGKARGNSQSNEPRIRIKYEK